VAPAGPRPGEALSSVCGPVVDHRGPQGEQCLVVDGGRVAGYAERPRGQRVLDVRGTGLVVAPGIVDMHVHLRGLRLSYKEDERTGTLEAAAGGVVLVVDMPNTVPRLSDPAALAAKLEALAEHSLVDYGVYAGMPREPHRVQALARAPVAGFKVYPEDYTLEESIAAAARSSKLLVVHPELPEAEAPVSVEDPAGRAEARGCHWEAAAPGLLAPLLDGARAHVTHASCASTVGEARAHGYTVDVAPHHLLYEARPRGPPCESRVNPPLRRAPEPSLLLRLLVEGAVDALASDHAPHARWEKSEPLSCLPGYPWLGLWPWALNALLHAALGLEGLLELASAGPARVLGVYGDYGLVDVGARASLIVFDPGARWRHVGFRYARHGLPAHFMLPARGLVHYTLVGGRLAYSLQRGPASGALGSNAFRQPP